MQGTCLPVVPLTVVREAAGKSHVLFELRADGIAVLSGPWMRISGDVVHDIEYGPDFRCDGRLVHTRFGPWAQFEADDSLTVHTNTGDDIRFTVTDNGSVIVDDPRGAEGYATSKIGSAIWSSADGLRVRGDVGRGRRTASILIALALLQ